MDDIVAESGLSKGSLYWYFKSKDDLFIEALMSVFADVGQEAAIALERCPTAAERLRAVAQAAVGITRRIEGIFSLFLEFWASSPRRDEAAQLWLRLLDQYKESVAGIIEKGAEDGEFEPVDAEHLAWAMMAAYDGLAAYIVLKPDLDLDRVSQVFVETILRGLTIEEAGDADRSAVRRDGPGRPAGRRGRQSDLEGVQTPGRAR
jgi:AcrR family transcriptional regulator